MFIVSCSPIQDACEVLHEADSLHSMGVPFTDSIRIADAVATFEKWNNRLFYTNEYARANYYYGRLLRTNNYLPDAMKCFINASHTAPNTHFLKRLGSKFRNIDSSDYVILGRVYSNMGSMCQAAKKFELSYQMYHNSSILFSKAGDLKNYYYTCNSMAFELAEQKRKEESLCLVNKVEAECSDSNVLNHSNIVKSALYCNMEIYDSALYYANRVIEYSPSTALGHVVKAQSLWFTGQYDSALSVAKHVMNLPNSSDYDKFNMLYIITYNNPSLNTEQVKKLSEQRTDIEVEKIVPQRELMKEAVHLLEQDLNTKITRSQVRFIIIVITIIIVISGCLWFVLLKIHRQEDLDFEKAEHETQRFQVLSNDNMLLQEHNDYLKQINMERKEHLLSDIENSCVLLSSSSNLRETLLWKEYDQLCELINNNFYFFVDKLKSKVNLSELEIRFCILTLIGISQTQMLSDLLNYSSNGIGKFKYRISKKLGTTSRNLRDYLLSIIVSDGLVS